MKTRPWALVLLGLLLARGLPAADAGKPVATEVKFDHPENFTDVKDGFMPTDRGREEILARIRRHLEEEGQRLLPAGYRLSVTFTDIDLAGDFEPTRNPLWDEVRIVKSIYPPAFKFTYVVTNPAGVAVRQGSEKIRDMNFELRFTADTGDSLHYEKDLLDDWMRSTLRGLKNS